MVEINITRLSIVQLQGSEYWNHFYKDKHFSMLKSNGSKIRGRMNLDQLIMMSDPKIALYMKHKVSIWPPPHASPATVFAWDGRRGLFMTERISSTQFHNMIDELKTMKMSFTDYFIALTM